MQAALCSAGIVCFKRNGSVGLKRSKYMFSPVTAGLLKSRFRVLASSEGGIFQGEYFAGITVTSVGNLFPMHDCLSDAVAQ